jgi:hypothetical protein
MALIRCLVARGKDCTQGGQVREGVMPGFVSYFAGERKQAGCGPVTSGRLPRPAADAPCPPPRTWGGVAGHLAGDDAVRRAPRPAKVYVINSADRGADRR